MIIRTVKFDELTASEGMTLTNGTEFSKGPICLGKNDSPKNWTEIPDEEAAAKIAEKEAEVQEYVV